MMRPVSAVVTLTSLLALGSPNVRAEQQPTRVVLNESFEAGVDRWEVLDPDTWRLKQDEAGNHTWEITARESQYEPPVRSPWHVALLRETQVASFELTFRVRSTKDTGDHRDCCAFFGYQDDRHFYYVH